MGGAETRYEVIFKCLDCSFGCIASVAVGWDELVVNAFGLDGTFEGD